MPPPYVCARCRKVQTDEPPWERIQETRNGSLFVHACDTCLTAALNGKIRIKPPKKETEMSMSKRHYEQIADAVAETVLDPDERVALTARLNAIFAADNPLFNREIFARRADAVSIEEAR